VADILEEMTACVPALRRYARALTHDRDWADDLVQDCLERAVRKRSLWRPVAPVRQWLFTILVNVYRNDLRQRRRTPAPLPLDWMANQVTGSDSPHGRLALADTARAMQALPAEQREALLLIAVEGMAYAEAAAVLGLPIGTLMSRLGRARATLRRLTGEGGTMLRAVT
jgi:RNA polymerase sigma-70 factor (ECF subfamily)